MRYPRPELLTILALLAAGCNTVPLAAPQVLLLRPPESLLQDCEVPKMAFRTNGELSQSILALKSALAACTLDKRLIREYLNESENAPRSGQAAR